MSGLSPIQLDAGLRAFRREFGTCASCHAHDHTIWACPVEAEKDRAAFAEAMEAGR